MLSVWSSSMMTPIGAASGFPAPSNVETIVSKIMPFENATFSVVKKIMAVKVALVYPYFHPANDNSIFRFPPLGLGYIAAALKKRSVEVELFDCTFMQFSEAIERVKR